MYLLIFEDEGDLLQYRVLLRAGAESLSIYIYYLY